METDEWVSPLLDSRGTFLSDCRSATLSATETASLDSSRRLLQLSRPDAPRGSLLQEQWQSIESSLLVCGVE